ncbi:AraC family transcriptional regulator [Clostridium sediminicola]|uniref:AraC family transcriptional regulator n=1 Tax=Clostridium sediminicola TaxID=3114879 RepID=UPI003D17DB62
MYFINRAGRNQANTELNIKRNSAYPYCSIHYVSRGSVFLFYKSKKFLLKKGDMFLLDPYNSHHYGINCNDFISLEWIEFAGGDSANIMNSVLNNISPIIEAPQNNRILNYLRRIFFFLNNYNEKNIYIISKFLYSILLYIIEISEYSYKSESLNSSKSKLKRVLDYIENNLEDNLSIENLSKISNYSPAYFARLFLKITGTTPGKYILNRRINKAKEFLCTTDKKIENISNDLGFCNTSHFIRNFKNIEGLTPNEFRKHARNYNITYKLL